MGLWIWVIVGWMAIGLFVVIGVVRNWTIIVEDGSKGGLVHYVAGSDCDVCNAKK